MINTRNNESELALPSLNIASILEKIILGGIVSILALPILGDYGLWLFPIGRDIVFKLTVEFLLLAVFLNILFKKPQAPMPNAQSSPKSQYQNSFSSLIHLDFIGHWSLVIGHLKTPITLSLFVFWLIMVLATLTSVQPAFSLWGNIYKNQGLLTWTHYLLFFFLLISFLKDKKRWQMLISWSIAVASTVGLVALWQMLQHDFAFRASATLNNSNFLAAYLVLLVPLTFAYFFMKRSWWLGAAAVLQLLALLFTQTRGGYIGLLLASLVFAVLYSRKGRIVILAAFFGLLIFAPPGQMFQQRLPNFTDRFLSVQDIKNSAAPRLEAWRAGLQGMLKKPLLGYGPENFFVAYDEHYSGFLDNDPTPPDLSPWEAWFDKAHNFIFDIGATSGFLGLFSYIAMFSSAIFLLLKNLRITDYGLRITRIGLISAFTGYLAQNFLGFDTTVPGIYLVFYLAYANFLTLRDKNDVQPASQSPKISNFKFQISKQIPNTKYQIPNTAVWLLGFITLLFLFIASLKIHTDILKANHQLNLAESLARSGQIEQGFAAFEKGLAYSAKPINPNLRRRYAVIALAYYDAVKKNCDDDKRNPLLTKEGRGVVDPEKCEWLYNDSKKKLARTLELQQKNAANEWPRFTRNYIYAAQIAHILGDYERSDEYFQEALQLSPNRKAIKTK